MLEYIKDKPSCGYEIIRALQERYHSFYTPSPGSVYPTLQMLEEMGYTTASERGGKRVYTITNEGSEYLNKQIEFKERTKSETRRWCNPKNINDINETMNEFEDFARLLRDKVRTADTKKLSRVRKVLASAHQEISDS